MKVGVVGAGMIVRLFLKAMQETDAAHPVAMWVMPHEMAAAQELAKAGGIDRIYTDYESFLHDFDIDVVYIGIINSKHYEFAKAALLAGKPVICEKPFTGHAWQAEELAAIAREKKLMLVEAVSFLHTPNYRWMRELVGKLQGVKLVRCDYAQYSSRYNSYLEGNVLPAFNPQLCGGALYDINIYNLNLVVGLFGEPENVHYYANKGFNGIDTSGVAVLDYGNFKAVCSGAKDSAGPCGTLITAANGYVQLGTAPNVFNAVSGHIDGEDVSGNRNVYESHMVYEFEEFARIWREQDLEAANAQLEHVLAVMRVADKLRRSAGIDFPEE